MMNNTYLKHKDDTKVVSDIEDAEVEDAEVEDTEVEDAEVEDAEVEDTEVEDAEVEDTEVEDDEDDEDELVISESNGNDYIKITKITAPKVSVTSQIMTYEEFVAVVGRRASMIERGSRVMIPTDGMDDVREIAKQEILEKKCPLVIYRRVGNKEECLRVSEMSVPLNARNSF